MAMPAIVWRALAIFAAVLVGGWWLHHSGYAKGKADCEAAHTLAHFEQFKAETERLADISTQLAGSINTLANTAPTVIKEYHETVVKTPLPASCVIDADRLRSIQAAIAQATTAGQRGSPMSASPGIQ